MRTHHQRHFTTQEPHLHPLQDFARCSTHTTTSHQHPLQDFVRCSTHLTSTLQHPLRDSARRSTHQDTTQTPRLPTSQGPPSSRRTGGGPFRPLPRTHFWQVDRGACPHKRQRLWALRPYSASLSRTDRDTGPKGRVETVAVVPFVYKCVFFSGIL